MKRSFVLSLATALAVMLSAGIVFAQTFTNISFNVPSGWTATEDSSGVVTVTNDSNSSESIMLQLGSMGTSTLQQIANAYYSRFSGTSSPTQGEGGNYYFSSQTSDGVRMFHEFYDHAYNSEIPEGYYFWECYVGNDTSALIEVFFSDGGIYDSLTFHPNSSNNTDPTDETDNTTGGTVQTFSSMQVLVPEGWNAAENDDGSIVYLQSSSDSSLFINLLVSQTNGASLSSIAEQYCESLNGENLTSENGYYQFTYVHSSGQRCTVFLDDNTTSSKVPSGYYWVQLVSNAVGSELMNEVLNSVVITVSGTGGNNGGDSNTGGGSSSSGGSSGGCSAGFGSLAILALCSAFIVRKSR